MSEADACVAACTPDMADEKLLNWRTARAATAKAAPPMRARALETSRMACLLARTCCVRDVAAAAARRAPPS